jgi:hypothetical protein
MATKHEKTELNPSDHEQISDDLLRINHILGRAAVDPHEYYTGGFDRADVQLIDVGQIRKKLLAEGINPDTILDGPSKPVTLTIGSPDQAPNADKIPWIKDVDQKFRDNGQEQNLNNLNNG